MPRPKYISLLDSPQVSPIYEVLLEEGFPKPFQSDKFPSLKKGKKDENSVVKWNQKTEIVKKLTDGSGEVAVSRSLHANKGMKNAYESLDVDLSHREAKH
jgi:hypothetical protein